MTDDPAPTATTESAGSRGRSPPHPALTFTEALVRAEQIYKKERRTPVNPDIAAQHMNYSKMNGSTYPIMSSLKRYGLAVSVDKDIKISDDAHFILCHPESDPERVAKIAKLAMSPEIFQEILAKYPELPSDESLIAKLQVGEWKFLKPAATLIVRALRDAIRLRDAAVAIGASSEDTATAPTKEVTVSNHAAQPMKPPMSGPNQPPPPGGRPPGKASREWELGEGRVVSAALPADATTEDIDGLVTLLGMWKQEIEFVSKKKSRPASSGSGS